MRRLEQPSLNTLVSSTLPRSALRSVTNKSFHVQYVICSSPHSREAVFHSVLQKRKLKSKILGRLQLPQSVSGKVDLDLGSHEPQSGDSVAESRLVS